MKSDWDIEDTRQPKDEPEAEYCESCGEELVYLKGYTQLTLGCDNEFCPELFRDKSIEKDMAQALVEARMSLEGTQDKLRVISNQFSYYKMQHPSKYDLIKQQSPVRDTEYQIRRMDDALDFVFGEERNHYQVTDGDMTLIDHEWIETKKILTNL